MALSRLRSTDDDNRYVSHKKMKFRLRMHVDNLSKVNKVAEEKVKAILPLLGFEPRHSANYAVAVPAAVPKQMKHKKVGVPIYGVDLASMSLGILTWFLYASSFYQNPARIPSQVTTISIGETSALVTVMLQDDFQQQTCWVCFATDEDDLEAEWVKPCRCRGTTKWVHQSCLQRWIDEKQKGNSSASVTCPQCNTEYIIVFPKFGPFLSVIDSLDKLIFRMCPFGAGLLFCGSVYWTAFTYGAVVIMQVFGTEEGFALMEEMDKLFLLISLPMIPTVLILVKMIRWEDYMLKLWRKYSSKLPIINLFTHDDDPRPVRIPADTGQISDPISATRILCGALIMPSFAVIFGKLMFSSVKSNFQRTMMGGVAFIAIKGALKIYYKQQQYIRQSRRIIGDFEEDIGYLDYGLDRSTPS